MLGLRQAAQFTGEKPRGFHRGLVAIIKIAGNHEGVDALADAQIYDVAEGLPGGAADEVCKFGVAHGKRLERGIQVDVSGMDEAKSRDRNILRRVSGRPCYVCSISGGFRASGSMGFAVMRH